MSFMSFVSCLAIAFALGIVVARKLMPRTGYKLPPTAPAQPATYTPKPYVPVKNIAIPVGKSVTNYFREWLMKASG